MRSLYYSKYSTYSEMSSLSRGDRDRGRGREGRVLFCGGTVGCKSSEALGVETFAVGGREISRYVVGMGVGEGRRWVSCVDC